MLVSILRLIFVLAGVMATSFAAQLTMSSSLPIQSTDLVFLIVVGFILVGAGSGYVLGGVIGRRLVPLVNSVELFLQQFPTSDLVLGTVGLIVGILVANLLFPLLREIEQVGIFLAAVAFFMLGSLGFEMFRRRTKSFAQVFRKIGNGSGSGEFASGKIFDTSVIIDGRIADVCRAGFVEGELKIPRFILRELQDIADSRDDNTRERGRRGLKILSRLQRELPEQLRVIEEDVPDEDKADQKLLKLAEKTDNVIVTVDYNLQKIAEVSGRKVMNVNELANALKPPVSPGDTITVKMVRAGKEPGQGVGYLDDGTMVVVEAGGEHLGRAVEVSVVSILQTASGKMVFTRVLAKERGSL